MTSLDAASSTSRLEQAHPLRDRVRAGAGSIAGITRREVTPFRLVLALLVATIFAFFYWTADSGLHPITVGSNLGDRYNLLADGFLHGHLGFRQPPPPGLEALPNPYDPVANAQYRGAGLHDVTLYHGRLYLYFGPTPALTLFAPFQLFGAGQLSESLAVYLYACLGLLFTLLLMRFLVRRYVPDTPAWMKLVAVAGVAAGSALPFVLRRPVTYEVAITAGYCFASAALWLFATGGLAERPSTRRLVLGSACLGLALGARPDLFVLGLVPLGLFAYFVRRGLAPDRGAKLRAAGALLGPVVLAGVVLLIYNRLRFDSFTEFGAKYMLAGADHTKEQGFRFSYIPPGLYLLLIAPARLTFTFPFFHLPPPPGYPGKLPVSYYEQEITGGLLSNQPVVWLLLALPFLWRKRLLSREGALVSAALVMVGLVLAAVIAWTLWGTTMRYELDFASLVLIAAFLSWFGLSRSLRSRRALRSLVAVAATALVAWGVAYGVAISFTGYDNGLATAHPGTYQSLTRFFQKIPTAIAMVTGKTVVTEVDNTTGVQSPSPDYTTFGQGPATFTMSRAVTTVRILAPGHERIYLRAGLRRAPGARAHSPLTLVALSDGLSAKVGVDGHQADIPVELHRGWNDVGLQAVEPRPKPTNVPPEAQKVIYVFALRLAKH